MEYKYLERCVKFFTDSELGKAKFRRDLILRNAIDGDKVEARKELNLITEEIKRRAEINKDFRKIKE